MATLNELEIVALGAGQEVTVGTVLFHISNLLRRGKTVMLDCGIHPGYSGKASLPYFDEIEMEDVDAMLVTHFHLDHCAAVPYVTAQTPFKGRILMTHPTKAIVGMLLRDFIAVSRGGVDEGLYTAADLQASLARTEVIDFHQTLDIDGIKVTAYRAGHVLGAAMFMVEIAGLRVLYTGDYSRLADRHLSAADLPELKPDVVIVEATYGVSLHEDRPVREARLTTRVRDILSRGGRVLMPVVALGRAQEILLILEEYWSRNPQLQAVPIYQASGLAAKSMTIYQTYIEMMNEDIRKAFQVRNPFVFQYVRQLRHDRIDDSGPCVLLATPSMLQSGTSRTHFEMWCEDRRNGVIIADFAVQGTLAREILGSPSEVMTRAGVKVPLRMSVDQISFSAHADYAQTEGFIKALQPAHVVLVHGESGGMMRLKEALKKQAALRGEARQFYTPALGQPVRIPHKAERMAKVVGRLADKPPAEGRPLAGLLVRHGYADSLMHPADLPLFTKLRPGRILQRQAVACSVPFAEVRFALENVFEGVHGAGELGGIVGDGSGAAIRIADQVTVVQVPGRGAGGRPHLLLEWEGGTLADMVADAAIAIMLQLGDEPANLAAAERGRRQACRDGDERAAALAEMDIVAALLDAQYGPTTVDAEQDMVVLQVGQYAVLVDHKTGDVHSADAALRGRVQTSVDRIRAAMRPVAVEEASP